MFKDLEKLLDAGCTPEQLYQEALRIDEAKKAAAKKIDEKYAEARENVIKALNAYAKILCGEPMSAAFQKEMVESLIDLEKIIAQFRSTETREEEKGGKPKCSDDEILYSFLKSLGAAR